ncbi:MAG: hypothetical protein ABIX46_09325 [Burkholderiaceae bacterium]
MSRALRILFGFTVTLLLLGALAVAAVIAYAHTAGSFDPIVLRIDGEAFELGGLSTGTVIAGVIALGVALLLALAVALLAVPLAVLLPLLALALPVGLALLLATGTVALVLSPLLFVVWLLWRLVRGAPRERGPATMTR